MNRIKIALFALLLSIAAFISNPSSTFAQQGCCSWHGGISYCDSSVGTYVCNDGTYSPSCGCYRTPQAVQPPDFPQNIQATLTYTPNTTRGYTVIATLTDKNPTKYSAVLSKAVGADPGPLVDFNGGVFTYFNVAPGNYYLNVKQDINGVWSKVVYWKVDVPAWISPTPAPTNIPIPTPTPVVKKTVASKSFINSFFEWISSLSKSKNTTTFAPTPTLKSAPYTCNCAKTCTQISTCAEAYYQLNTCGCSVRDGDHDGVPCENLCR